KWKKRQVTVLREKGAQMSHAFLARKKEKKKKRKTMQPLFTVSTIIVFNSRLVRDTYLGIGGRSDSHFPFFFFFFFFLGGVAYLVFSWGIEVRLEGILGEGGLFELLECDRVGIYDMVMSLSVIMLLNGQ
ncbi:hypothetical protein GGR50DRAFT_648409, partial [Xylaria sp. CBS 124048]